MIARSRLFIICPYSPPFLCVRYWEGLYHNDRSRKYHFLEFRMLPAIPFLAFQLSVQPVRGE